MMLSLRNRFRAATKSLMADHSSSQSPPPTQKNYTKPVPSSSSLLGSPRFKAFAYNKNLLDSDPVMSPTSILDTTKPFPALKNPFWCQPSNQPKTPKLSPIEKQIPSCDKTNPKGIGVVLYDDNTPPVEMVSFGTKLGVKIPSLQDLPNSRRDFGIKSPLSSQSAFPSGGVVLAGLLSPSEMELSEEYTCVVYHGTNPKTTHIYGSCVLDNFCSRSSPKNNAPPLTPSSKSFLSYCYTCKKDIGQGNDIYIYRGEKAFCSPECRYQEMLLDDKEES